MSNAYEACKELAYPILSTAASCDHATAKSKGYKDGWQMLLDKHDDDEMAVFCASLSQQLSKDQAKILLDGLVEEYTEFSNWLEFVNASSDYPDWRPSRENTAQYKDRINHSSAREIVKSENAESHTNNVDPVEQERAVDADSATLSGLAERFIWARKRSGKTQEEISDLCGLKKSAISQIENKKHGISGENVFPIADALGVDAKWLLTGDGSPDSEGETPIPPKIKRIAEHLAALPDDRLTALSVVLGIKL